MLLRPVPMLKKKGRFMARVMKISVAVATAAIVILVLSVSFAHDE